jgi:tetratricopeptide (TPR) repeat protein
MLAEAHVGLPADIARLDARLSVSPDDVEALLERSACYRRLGDFARAMADLEHVARLAPLERRLWLERGLTYAAMKDTARAEHELDLLLASGPSPAEAWRTRALLREETGRLKLAIADYSEALKLRPDPELYLARGRLQEEAGELSAAARGYEVGLRALQGAVVLRLALLRVEKQRGEYGRAQALIDALLPTLQVKADWYLERAEVHALAGRRDAARKDREAAVAELNALLQRRPNTLWLLSRAKAHLALGRATEALADLERVTQQAPRLEEAHALLTTARQLAAASSSRRRNSP